MASEDFDREDARCPNCDNVSILQRYCEHCGYGLDGLDDGEDNGSSKPLKRRLVSLCPVFVGWVGVWMVGAYHLGAVSVEAALPFAAIGSGMAALLGHHARAMGWYDD